MFEKILATAEPDRLPIDFHNAAPLSPTISRRCIIRKLTLKRKSLAKGTITGRQFSAKSPGLPTSTVAGQPSPGNGNYHRIRAFTRLVLTQSLEDATGAFGFEGGPAESLAFTRGSP
jgi:hypothetical protein